MKMDEFIAQDVTQGYLGVYRIVDENISVGTIKENADLTTDMINLHVQMLLGQMQTQQYYSVLNIRHVLWASSDAKNWIKTEFAKRHVLGYAIVAETVISSMIADIWIKLTDLPFPVKKFKDYEGALAWVRELKAENEVLLQAS